MEGTFFFCTDPADTVWPPVVRAALAPWGEVEVLAIGELSVRLQNHLPAALLLDAGQCDDVVGIIQQVKQLFPELPVIVLTASAAWQLLRHVYQAGAQDCVKMSLDPQQLRVELRQALEPVP